MFSYVFVFANQCFNICGINDLAIVILTS